MQIWMTLMLVLQLVAAIAMIGLVLVQHGKGADMGASFGSGASGSLFGATGSANFLSRSTAAAATVFFLATLGLAFSAGHRSADAPARASGASVLDRPVAASAVGAIPAAAPAVVPAASTAAPAAATAAPATAVPTPIPAPIASR